MRSSPALLGRLISSAAADFSVLRISSPYDKTARWRETTEAGFALRSVSRAFGRLMGDDRHKALFTTGVPDMPRATLTTLMENVANCRDGRLAQIEVEFYEGAERLYQSFQQALSQTGRSVSVA